MLFKSFVALAALATFAVAAPAKRQFTPDGETCDFVLSTVSTPPDEFRLESEFNYMIGEAIAVETPSSTIFNFGSTHATTGAGEYSINIAISAADLSDEAVGEIAVGLVGQTLVGLPWTDEPRVQWLVNSVKCE